MKFTKTILVTPNGRQPTKWDYLVTEYDIEGMTLHFNEKVEKSDEGITRQSASQGAKRLSLLTGFKFHSFFDTIENKIAIRRRHSSDLIKSDESEENQEETSE